MKENEHNLLSLSTNYKPTWGAYTDYYEDTKISINSEELMTLPAVVIVYKSLTKHYMAHKAAFIYRAILLQNKISEHSTTRNLNSIQLQNTTLLLKRISDIEDNS